VEEVRDYVLTGRSDWELLFGSSLDIRRLINEMMTEVCREKGLGRFTSHGFRHCMGSHLLKNGCDIRYIQEMLGHESIGTTQVYTRVVKEDLRGVIDAYHPRSMARRAGPVEVSGVELLVPSEAEAPVPSGAEA